MVLRNRAMLTEGIRGSSYGATSNKQYYDDIYVTIEMSGLMGERLQYK